MIRIVIREDGYCGDQGIKEFSGGGGYQQCGSPQRDQVRKTEDVSVGFGSWEVKVKFYKDCFCGMVQAEVTCRRLMEIR